MSEEKVAKITLSISPEIYNEIGKEIIGNALDMLADVAEQELGILSREKFQVKAILRVGYDIIVKDAVEE